jgi:hypothetical protein
MEFCVDREKSSCCERIDVADPWLWVPRATPSMRHALADLDLDRLVVVHAGDDAFPLAERIDAVPAARLLVDGWDATLR